MFSYPFVEDWASCKTGKREFQKEWDDLEDHFEKEIEAHETYFRKEYDDKVDFSVLSKQVRDDLTGDNDDDIIRIADSMD